MSKAQTLFIVGVLVIILPFLGFPWGFKKILFVLIGLGLIYFSYGLRVAKKEIPPSNEPHQ